MHNSVVTRCVRFELLHELGRGLKSTVYFARDPEIERSVALKIFNEPPASTEAFAARVKAASNLSHLGIAKVFDISYTEPDGLPYIVLEYIDGKSLESVLSRRGKIPQAEALALTLELLEALAYAHSLGVHHRNLRSTTLNRTP